MLLNYDEMIALAESKKELSVKFEQVGCTEVAIFTYNVQMTDTFDSELAKWFRGTVFDVESKICICRPFPKFFNLNEHEESKEENVDWNSALYYHKVDGSLVMPVLFPDGDIYWKSKSTFYSEHALRAKKIFSEMDEESRDAAVGLLVMGYTPLFEFISNDPEFRIVIEYSEEKLVYLGSVEISSGLIIPAPVSVEVNREEIADMEGIEGFVIFDGKKLVKMKTMYYIIRHRAVWGTTKKSIVVATLDNSIDDVIGVVAGLGMKDLLADIEGWRDNTNWELIAAREYVDDTYAQVKKELPEGYTRKDFALKLKTDFRHDYHKFFFALEDGRDITQMIKDYVFEIMLKS